MGIKFHIIFLNKYKENTMIITKHGKIRIKERLGLPKRAQNRHILTVLNKGILLSREGMKRFQIIYQNFLYIFALTDQLEAILITTHSFKYNNLIEAGEN